MHLSPEAHGPVERSRRFGAPPRSLLESCRVTPAPGRPGRDSARRLPPGCPYAQQARAPASGSQRVRRHNQPNAARAQFWLGAEFVALQLKRSFSRCAVLRTKLCVRAPHIGPWAHSHSAAQPNALTLSCDGCDRCDGDHKIVDCVQRLGLENGEYNTAMKPPLAVVVFDYPPSAPLPAPAIKTDSVEPIIRHRPFVRLTSL